MKVLAIALAGAFLLSIFAIGAPAGDSSQIARGKYLVDDAGKCGDCHTPFNEKGEPDQTKYLKGSVLAFKPTIPMPVWADQAPPIEGLRMLDEKAAVHFLMTATLADGKPARPPMPTYRFNEEDAKAIVAYLKSLK
jgi:mono/diheme cytochrome c family protein